MRASSIPAGPGITAACGTGGRKGSEGCITVVTGNGAVGARATWAGSVPDRCGMPWRRGRIDATEQGEHRASFVVELRPRPADPRGIRLLRAGCRKPRAHVGQPQPPPALDRRPLDCEVAGPAVRRYGRAD